MEDRDTDPYYSDYHDMNFWGSSFFNWLWVDLNNTGIISRFNTKTIVTTSDYHTFHYIDTKLTNQEALKSNVDHIACCDINRDGFVDIVLPKYNPNTRRDYLVVWLGGEVEGEFEEHMMVDLQQKHPWGKIVDINNDGYFDIISPYDDTVLKIYYGKPDLTWSEDPLVIDLSSYGVVIPQKGIVINDFDNNGYIDIGIKGQGIIYNYNDQFAFRKGVDGSNFGVVLEDGGYPSSSSGNYKLLSTIKNESPQKPAYVTLKQTEKGLVIDWADAEDDYTPAAQMRYNVSVKRKGKTGEGSYVISPMNGGDSKSNLVFPYYYKQSTTMTVPFRALEVGETYEVQVQAIDLWGQYSQMTEPVEITISPIAYTLTYIVDGEVYKKASYYFEDAVTPESVPTKEGHTFSGWSEVPNTMPAHDVTVTGSFSINSYKLTYVVDGKEYKSTSIVYGTTVTAEAAPIKEGYTFSGWSEVPNTMPAHDVKISGIFTINKYKVVYIVDGVEYGTSEIEYGAEVNPIGEPKKEGYTFSGWQNLPDMMPAHDVTITGTFSVNQYKVTFMYGDNVLTTVEVNYGETIELPESLNSERYTLISWKDVPDTMPAHDVTIYADYVDGISTIAADRKDEQYIQMNGMYTNDLKQGLNIIRTQDGRTTKVWVK